MMIVRGINQSQIKPTIGLTISGPTYSLLEVHSCPESRLDQHRLPLRILLRTPFALPSHTPNTPAGTKAAGAKTPGRFERSLALDDGALRKAAYIQM